MNGAVIDTMLDIPYEIIKEDVEFDYGSFVIHRTYKLPKSFFKSPLCYLVCIRKYEGKVIYKNGLKAFLYTTGWKDANCRSYGIMIVIEKVDEYEV